MAHFDIIMPKMGESIEEATITKWFVKEGDKVVEDDVLLEIATDKVDSEIPSPVEGVVKKIFFEQDETVAVGTVIAVIDLEGGAPEEKTEDKPEESTSQQGKEVKADETSEREEIKSGGKTDGEQEVKSDDKAHGKTEGQSLDKTGQVTEKSTSSKGESGRFYSPLVKKIANEENISMDELETIQGSGLNGRVQKKDILDFINSRGTKAPVKDAEKEKTAEKAPAKVKVNVTTSDGDEIIEMSRIRKLIAAHMLNSKQTSAHVTNMLEIDVTNVVNWRNRVKNEFEKKQGQKLTYLPVFMEATVKALRDHPMINSSVDGDKIIIRKNINLGIAVALEDNNLIVPNIKNADQLNLPGLTMSLNKIANAARSNKLGPDDISGGTFTITNFGTFKNDIGTPIINQPEVAILAVGAIKKKPAVLETPEGDVIAIRQKMWLSLTYDHRIIDGALGGMFLRTLGDYIESFDVNRTI
jgi:2-oxoglutarate dehydrogenase E2 component (dihydrolipoamide succinyltransferase)